MARAAEALSAEEQGTRRRLLSFLGWGSFVSFCSGVTIGVAAVFLSENPLRTFAAIYSRQAGRLSGR